MNNQLNVMLQCLADLITHMYFLLLKWSNLQSYNVYKKKHGVATSLHLSESRSTGTHHYLFSISPLNKHLFVLHLKF